MSKRMSKRQKRIAKAWMPHYKKLLGQRPKGCLVHGGGIKTLPFIREAEIRGYFPVTYPGYTLYF